MCLAGRMCGRYASSASRDQLVETFMIDDVVVDHASGAQSEDPELWLAPRWNIAPTDTVRAVLERLDKAGTDEPWVRRRLVGLRWGLVPRWAKNIHGSARMINARLETVAEKPSFRKAMASRRCLIPADGYFEWHRNQVGATTVKRPFFIYPADPVPVAGSAAGLMAMAGIYEFWRDPNPIEGVDPWLASCSIITTTASNDLGMIHDRMPVQVRPENWSAWLDPAMTNTAEALSLVHRPETGEMTAHAVSRRVNTVANDGPDLVAPASLV